MGTAADPQTTRSQSRRLNEPLCLDANSSVSRAYMDFAVARGLFGRRQEGILSMKYGHPEAIQVVFNLLRQEAKNQLFQAARERNVGIIAREPLSNGFLTGKFTLDSTFPSGDIRSNFPRNYLASLIGAAQQLRLLESKTRTLAQASLRFALDHKDISTVIPGAKTPQQTEENLNASDLPPLTGEELLRIRILREQRFA